MMNSRNASHRLMMVGLALLAGALACSAPGADISQVAPTGLPTSGGPTAPTSEPANGGQPTATDLPGDVTAACPQAAGASTVLYVSQENGVCFLYPAELRPGTAFRDPSRVAAFNGPPLDPNSMEPALVHVEVAYNGLADVADSAAYAAKWVGAYGAGASNPASATIGGQPAMVVPDVPGMMAQRVGLVVVNGQKYSITLMPAPDQVEGLKAQAEDAWNTITGSMVFFQPSVVPTFVRSEDVCHETGAVGDILFIDLAGGVCMIYPASFDINAEFSHGTGWFEGGPILGEIFSRPLKAELVLAYAGPAEGKTPRQLWEPRLVNQEVSKIDVAGAKDVTLNGFPAIVWAEGEPLGSRQAIIVANDRMYTIVNQPYNDPDYPGGEENVETVWRVVTESVAFFDVWY